MAFRLVRSGGFLGDPALLNMAASGVIRVGGAVDFLRTAGQGVSPSAAASTFTTIFGVAYSAAAGTSDSFVDVVPFMPNQLWEVDCVNAASTAQVGLRHILTDHLNLYNTGTDNTTASAVFHAVAMVGLTTGSGKLLGFIRKDTASPTISAGTAVY